MKKITNDVKFSERPETMFAKLQRLKYKEEPPLIPLPVCPRLMKYILKIHNFNFRGNNLSLMEQSLERAKNKSRIIANNNPEY